MVAAAAAVARLAGPSGDPAVAAATRLVGSVGFALRKSKRVLHAGPRRDLIVESLAVAVSLLAELADTTPQFVVAGGLDKLVQLARPNNDLVANELVLEDAPVHETEALDARADAEVSAVTQFVPVVSEQMPELLLADADEPLADAENKIADDILLDAVETEEVDATTIFECLTTAESLVAPSEVHGQSELLMVVDAEQADCLKADMVVSQTTFSDCSDFDRLLTTEDIPAGFLPKTLMPESLSVAEEVNNKEVILAAPVGLMGAPAVAKTITRR